MPVNGKEQNKGRPLSRRYLCCMLADDKNAGHLLAFIVGWHKHATLPRQGKTGLWNAFSLAMILAGAGLTPKQWYRSKALLEGLVHIEPGGFAGKRTIWTQPCLTAQAECFLAGEYRTKSEARKALALLKGNLKQAPQVPVGSVSGQNQGKNQGQNPILSTLPSLPTKKNKTLKGLNKGKEKQLDSKNKSQYEGKKMPDSAQESIQHTATPHTAAHSASAHTQQHPELAEEPGQTNADLYPEVPIPKGCPLKHPRQHYGKRWATFSPKVKADLYAWFQQALENWLNGKAGKHAASVYGFGKYPCSSYLAGDPPGWEAEEAKIIAEYDALAEKTG